MNLLSRFTVAQRFATLVALCALAILVPATMHTVNIWGGAQVVQRELDGLTPARTLLEAVRLAQHHRGLSAVWLGGKEDQASARAAKADEVDRVFAQFTQQLAADGAADTALAKHWAGTREAWTLLR